ncbi:tRNA-dihydrouridine(20/20a) synthase (EC 1.3.1.91) [uncultured Gammaproteobacteria bacterium]|jgi:tRNA-dihydrouridine synthase A|uniref:tRNA-dihydrouridine(20/20a) synthase n=3 Tax=sulfur-oxidizing symbionts TaxID=32036 RepID=A0A1H6MZ24_9GAMM|nr:MULTISPECIES: tRNA dihydrouridine(20/20a) synthase DusA [sulfur-oxidizing symbionts]CAC5827378.1 tRNA-dihydrouridine(20/20a) synthase (EC 1.3.1.91) [uncultured Gammaproteobacteria bacterium]CAB5500489.1 tRNA-dihydrouridine(20/20a) synthase (EC [Bathymodiolus azoricus thioautotrophic gill symbiont]CAB5503849.1 tRNA-dihydrouridine(20/20a) synthase (EC [Bathymodiolus thermophilus thioautotrophic gill symbiont]CAC9493357.1 tRNA-dihydrouridine(20/20a) synthase (EC 1.3.1.91) [uncultured Gammaprote
MHKFSVAPMMDWTDRHCRYFHRLLSKETQLWSEMVTTKAILNGDKNRLLDFDAAEHPLVLQLGGSESDEMAQCAKIAQNWGYDEVNINVGCPSDRVQSGSFGACLMQTPEVVAQCVDAMRQASDISVSVKSRIGVDDMESYKELSNFVMQVENAGCDVFVIHARKAWLKGLSPKENRTVPSLNYEWVYRIKKDFPHLAIAINGGIMSVDEATVHLQSVDSVMLGRVAYHQPYLLSEVDNKIYHKILDAPSREQVLLDFIEYIKKQNDQGVPIRSMTRHILGLYHAQPSAKKFRQLLSGKVVELKHLYQWLDFTG